MFKRRNRNNKGFTLIELLVVIAIIGLLASIITVSLVSARAKGRDAKRVADIRTIQLALESFYNDNAYYPSALSFLAPTYLPVVPTDPNNTGTNYKYSAANSSGSTNCNTNKPTRYHLGADLEGNRESNPALNQDVDGAILGSGLCNTHLDFIGTAPGCVDLVAAGGGADDCYDQTN